MPKKIDYGKLFTLRADGRYCASYTDASGKRKYLYDRDPERLHEKLDEARHPEERLVTFRESAEAWEAGYRETIEERTWKNYIPHYKELKAMWGDVPTVQITAEMINADLLRAKAKGYSHTVVNERKVIINGVLNYALAHGDIPFNPALSVRLPKGLPKGKRHAPSNNVLQIVCQNLDKPFGIYAFLLFCTGVRKSEALALHKGDVDFTTTPKRININRSLTYVNNSHPREKLPKGNRKRWVPIPDILEDPLKKYMAQTPGDLLFPQPATNRGGEGGGYMSEGAYERAWHKFCVEVGLVDEAGKHTLTAHPLRHATATVLMEAGVDVFTTQSILGHANVSTTQEIYQELREEQKKKSIKKYDKSLRKLSPMLSKTAEHK